MGENRYKIETFEVKEISHFSTCILVEEPYKVKIRKKFPVLKSFKTEILRLELLSSS